MVIFYFLEELSFFRCPVCGLLRSPRTYDPEDYDNEIMLVYMTSKGRGRGFETVGEELLEEDTELFRLISDRVRSLDEALNHQEQPSSGEQLDSVEELTDELSPNQNKTEDLLDLINEALNDEEYDDLEEAVYALIDEYLDLVEETQDLSDN